MSGTWGNVVRNVGARKQTIHAELGGHHGWFCAGKSKREQREEIDSEPGGMTFHNVYGIVCERDTGERARTRQHVFHFDGSQWKGGNDRGERTRTWGVTCPERGRTCAFMKTKDS